MTTFYLIDVQGCVEPHLFGPISAEAVDRTARRLHAKQDDTDALFLLTIDAKGEPAVESFSASFFEDEDAPQ